MRLLLLPVIVIFLFACSESGNKLANFKKGKNNTQIYFNYSSHELMDFKLKVKNITLVPFEGEKVSLTPNSIDMPIRSQSVRSKLGDMVLPYGDYAGIIFDIDLSDTHIQMPYYRSWQEIDLLDVALVVPKEGQSTTQDLSQVAIKVTAPFRVVEGQPIDLQIFLDTHKAFPSLGLDEKSPQMAFVPAFDLQLLQGSILHGKNLAAKDKISETLDEVVPVEIYVVTSVSKEMFIAKRDQDVKTTYFKDTTLVTEDGKPLQPQDLMIGQRVYFTDEHTVAKQVVLTARVLSVTAENQQVTVEPLLINKLAPLSLNEKAQQASVKTIQLRRRKGAKEALKTSLTNEEMSAIFLSPTPPVDLLVTFYGYISSEDKLFESYHIKVDDLSALQLILEPHAEKDIQLTVIDTTHLLTLDFHAPQINMPATIKTQEQPLILNEEVSQIKIRDPVQLHMIEMLDGSSTSVDIHQFETVKVALNELIKTGASIKKLTALGDLVGGGFVASRLDVVFVGSVDDVVPEEKNTVAVGADDKTSEPEPKEKQSRLSTVAVTSIAVGAGAAVFIGAVVLYKLIKVNRDKVKKSQWNGGNGSPKIEPKEQPIVSSFFDAGKLNRAGPRASDMLNQATTGFLDTLPSMPQEQATRIVHNVIDEVLDINEKNGNDWDSTRAEITVSNEDGDDDFSDWGSEFSDEEYVDLEEDLREIEEQERPRNLDDQQRNQGFDSTELPPPPPPPDMLKNDWIDTDDGAERPLNAYSNSSFDDDERARSYSQTAEWLDNSLLSTKLHKALRSRVIDATQNQIDSEVSSMRVDLGDDSFETIDSAEIDRVRNELVGDSSRVLTPSEQKNMKNQAKKSKKPSWFNRLRKNK